MSNVDIYQEEIDKMSNSELEHNIIWETKFSLDENNRYREIHAINVELLIANRNKRNLLIDKSNTKVLYLF